MTTKTAEKLATRLAGAKKPCQCYECHTVEGHPVVDTNFCQGKMFCCSGTGQVYVFHDSVRLPCTKTQHTGVLCHYTFKKGIGVCWTASMDLATWIQDIFAVWPNACITIWAGWVCIDIFDRCTKRRGEPLEALLWALEQARGVRE